MQVPSNADTVPRWSALASHWMSYDYL